MRTKILKTLGLFVLIVTLYSCNNDSNEIFEDNIVKPQIVKSDIVGYEVIVRPGYQLDTSRPDRDCWIYGTWYEDTVTGDSFFLDASYISQALNNVCADFGGRYA